MVKKMKTFSAYYESINFCAAESSMVGTDNLVTKAKVTENFLFKTASYINYKEENRKDEQYVETERRLKQNFPYRLSKASRKKFLIKNKTSWSVLT